jgi:hypothetical protein
VITTRRASPSPSLAISLNSSAAVGVVKSVNAATLTLPRHVLTNRGSAFRARSIVDGVYTHTSSIDTRSFPTSRFAILVRASRHRHAAVAVAAAAITTIPRPRRARARARHPTSSSRASSHRRIARLRIVPRARAFDARASRLERV